MLSQRAYKDLVETVDFWISHYNEQLEEAKEVNDEKQISYYLGAIHGLVQIKKDYGWPMRLTK